MFILTVPIPTPLGRSGLDKNPSARLAEIRNKIVTAEQRVRDLEALLTELILQQDGGPGIGGQDENGIPTGDYGQGADVNAIRQELFRARAFEGELRTAEQFWQNVVTSNKEAEKETHDLFKKV